MIGTYLFLVLGRRWPLRADCEITYVNIYLSAPLLVGSIIIAQAPFRQQAWLIWLERKCSEMLVIGFSCRNAYFNLA